MTIPGVTLTCSELLYVLRISLSTLHTNKFTVKTFVEEKNNDLLLESNNAIKNCVETNRKIPLMYKPILL